MSQPARAKACAGLSKNVCRSQGIHYLFVPLIARLDAHKVAADKDLHLIREIPIDPFLQYVCEGALVADVRYKDVNLLSHGSPTFSFHAVGLEA
jgi:hypothetical protein